MAATAFWFSARHLRLPGSPLASYRTSVLMGVGSQSPCPWACQPHSWWMVNPRGMHLPCPDILGVRIGGGQRSVPTKSPVRHTIAQPARGENRCHHACPEAPAGS